MKRIIMLIIVIIAVFAGSFALTGCSGSPESSAATESVQTIEDNNLDTNIYAWRDPETGVNYIIYEGYRKGGITVRYNADGTVMTTPAE